MTPTGSAQTNEYATQEVSIFGGGQAFDITRSRPDHNFADGVVFGGRYTNDFARRIGLEVMGQYGINNLKLFPVQPYPVTMFGAGVRNYQAYVGPVFYFTPRESKFRPFLRVGAGAAMYDPTTDAAENFRRPQNAYLQVQSFNMKFGPAAFFGGGIKYAVSRRIGIRFDVGGMLSQTPHFKLPDYPRGLGSAYIPRNGSELPLSATASVVFRFGFRSDVPPAKPLPPAPPPPPEPPKPEPPAIQLGMISGIRPVCPGENLDLSVTANVTPPGTPLTYRWTINGTAFAGNAAQVTLPTTGLNQSNPVAVTVTAGETTQTATGTVELKPATPPTVTFSGLPATIKQGERLPLNATASASECCPATTTTYTSSEGTVTGNNFDSTSVAFDMSNRNRRQTKVVRVTATVTDRCGGTASANGEVTVVLDPQALRLDDLVFPTNNTRVNNCAKRVLLEVLTPLLRDNPEGRVILIGHTDGRERAGVIDKARVLNAAAVISAGSGICPQLDLARVQGTWVGTQEGSTPRPALCGASTEVRERSGQTISANDPRAQFRRVEVWFVPEGAQLPAELQNVPAIPAAQVTPLGCPR